MKQRLKSNLNAGKIINEIKKEQRKNKKTLKTTTNGPQNAHAHTRTRTHRQRGRTRVRARGSDSHALTRSRIKKTPEVAVNGRERTVRLSKHKLK